MRVESYIQAAPMYSHNNPRGTKMAYRAMLAVDGEIVWRGRAKSKEDAQADALWAGSYFDTHGTAPTYERQGP